MIEGLSKAKMLIDVKSKVSLFHVPELQVFSTSLYHDSPDEVVNQIVEKFKGRQLVVRSSAYNEDCSECTLAGEYDSVLNVPSTDSKLLHSAINRVVESYGRDDWRNYNDEFFVQEMVLDTSMCGVVFTHDLNTGAPYYVINYDDITGLTNTVTSGEGEYANRTLYVHRGALEAVRSKRFMKLLSAVQELEEVMGSQFLDVEFALDNDFMPYLLQVRSITTQLSWNHEVARRVDDELLDIQTIVSSRMKPIAGVYGNTTVLGQMPDWNPAEMIGRAPRALAFSLYKTLITDNAWSIARKAMGYAVPSGQPLMVSLSGQPYIDTRLSFHSYLPDELTPEISNKLVNAWLSRLQSEPELHDKVEFEIAITTYSFDIDQKIAELVGDVLSEEERSNFKDVLFRHTYRILTDDGESSIGKALSRLEVLSNKQVSMYPSKTDIDILDLSEMIDDCIQLGTVPFAILARHGFIARTILLSLNRCGIFTTEDINSIQSSYRTVASKLVNDMHRLRSGELSRSDFMSEYGHLRPGTYDILSRRYDQMPELGLNKSHGKHEQAPGEFILNNDHRKEINKLLQAEGFTKLNADKLLAYIEDATVGREFGKFVFTRSVSEMLELIAGFGNQHDLGREEMSHISLSNLLDVATKSTGKSIEDQLRQISEDEAEHHALSVAIRLPQVLFDEAGVHVVPFQVSSPNFITHEKVTANSVCVHIGQDIPELTGKIVMIENADPGFDWIFSQQIGGLITKYGGVNSHMAIRCAEFGIPAAIGCGEQRYESLKNSSQLLLDCAAGLITATH